MSYRGWTMNWQGGRQLASMAKGSDTLSFAYNESGLRTSKTINSVSHSYVWQGSKLAADITDAYALYFHYDSSGEVIGFTRTANGADTEYFYVKNLQGDILKVITATGTEAATYTYDAWGKLLTSTGDLADINPLRYRGYFYDTETGLYYLQSRYYDPEVSRFINPDAFATTDADGVLSANMFAYCENNPVNNDDPTGHGLFSTLLIGAAVGVVKQFAADLAYSALDTESNGVQFSSLGTYAAAAFSGAMSVVPGAGTVAAIVVDVVGSAFINHAVDAAVTANSNGSSFWGEFKYGEFISDVFWGGLFAGVGYRVDSKTPQFIRDIKNEARALGIRGTNQLNGLLYSRQQRYANIAVAVDILESGVEVVRRFFETKKELK